MSAADDNSMDPSLLETLTDEERQAMEADDMSEEDRQALQAVADGAAPASTDTDNDEDDDPDDDAPPVEGEPAAAPAAAPAEAPAAAAPAEAPAPTTTEDDDAPVMQFDAQLPADYDDQVKALSTRQAEVMEKFNDGEIDLAERDAQLNAINTDREQLLLVRARVESMQEMNRQAAQQHWQRTISNFMADAAKPQGGGIDYKAQPAMAQDLDTFVKMLANKEENADRSPRWFLEEAHKRVMALHGIELKAGALRKTDAERLAEARASRKAPTGDLQPNLAGVPGSDGPGDVSSEFADVESLEGQELEDAIARMTPDQRAKFLRG